MRELANFSIFYYTRPMKYGILRVACASPALRVADCEYNASQIINAIKEAENTHIRLLALPELSITGYTCGDLFLQQGLRKAAIKALLRIAKETADCSVLSVVGLPFEPHNTLYNCAAFIYKGKVLALVPKSFIPNYGEFYERRWFSPATTKIRGEVLLEQDGEPVPFGTNIILYDVNDGNIQIAAEICEDAWVPLSPSTHYALHGATIIVNLSASNEVVGKAEYRKMLVCSHSAKTMSAYLYADAGHDESSTDMVFSGHNIIAANGTVCAESQLFSDCGKIISADIDMERIAQDRLRTTTFADNMDGEELDDYCHIPIELKDNDFATEAEKSNIGFSPVKNTPPSKESLLGTISKTPFVPSGTEERASRCHAVIEMQAEGLAKRLRHIHAESAVIGLSGGLDSTLALLVTARAFDKCSLPRSGIHALTMPCFGTTDRTYNNACLLARKTGASLSEIDIRKAVLQHFADIGHDESVHDVTYENSQARERTQILMDWANKTSGIVIGTGDLSELALGWCTYNGDHISMYGVNTSIPKTLVRYLVGWFADEAQAKQDGELSAVLYDILDTPVSPELLPPEGGSISQKTEELVGPYELHDFFLYYVLRWGFRPEKIFFLARQAFAKAEEGRSSYTAETILSWLKTFYRRFFSQQFKRSCMPDGAKVGTVSLSPRGDWRMPSDAVASAWLSELEELEAGVKEEQKPLMQKIPILRLCSPLATDIARLKYISELTFRETFESTNSAKDMDAYCAKHFNEKQLEEEIKTTGTRFYLAQLEGETTAYMKLNYGKAQTEQDKPNSLEIQRLYVAKKYKQKHIGSRLIAEAEDIARSLHAEYIWLGVWEHNNAALAFYESKGFEVFSSHDFVLGSDHQTDKLMKKSML